MANIIRCVLPDGVHRFKPFKVEDYRDFLLVRNDMETKSEEEQKILVDELIADYFGEFPESWQKFIFLNVYTGSIGNTKIPVVYECPKCKQVIRALLNLHNEELLNPEVQLSDSIKLIFKFPETTSDNAPELVLNNIIKVEYEGEKYNWDDLDDQTKNSIGDLLTIEKFEQIVKSLKPIHYELRLRCCGKESTIVYDDMYSLFSLLINPDEIFPFYEINHIMNKHGYSTEDIMNMLPVERTMLLALIEKDSKK